MNCAIRVPVGTLVPAKYCPIANVPEVTAVTVITLSVLDTVPIVAVTTALDHPVPIMCIPG